MAASVGGVASKGEEASRLGAGQVIGKPVDDETLRALLTQEFERSTSQSGS